MNLTDLILLSSNITKTDGYKFSHWLQYPENVTDGSAYVESRGGEFDYTVFNGLQYVMTEFLTRPITQAEIDVTEPVVLAYGVPFNRAGWEYIVRVHGGLLPVEILAVPEGTIVPVHNALAVIKPTDPNCVWIMSYIEPVILRAIWYPTNVATISKNIQLIIKDALEQTADDLSELPFKLHDFGARGATCSEAAGIGGAAHLINFKGTDTFEGIMHVLKYYGMPPGILPGYTIPAAEHSTITGWGRPNEFKAYKNMLDKFAKPGALLAVVSDSYDIDNAVANGWGGELRQQVIDSGAVVVIRPDSGEPVKVVTRIAITLAQKFGTTKNSKGYMVLNHVRIIQGDGINETTIKDILTSLKLHGFSASNVAFGMGGALLQRHDRDTQRFAFKTSYLKVDGEDVDVYKDPITDPGKRSKRGQLTLIQNNDQFKTVRIEEVAEYETTGWKVALVPVFNNGVVLKKYTWEEVCENSMKHNPISMKNGK